ncbi:MAG: GNAT family N-acetyltransferase [Phycisphaerales bacterium]|nr:MAG: GNAT family N-acetyltransferase [Phycisphaerales bacterium]
MKEMNQRTALGLSLNAFALLMIAVCLIYELVTPSVSLGTLWFSYLVGAVLLAVGFLLMFVSAEARARRRKVQFSVILEQDISPDLDKEIRDLLAKCFPADREYYGRQSWWHCVPAYRVIGRDSQGAIVAHAGVVDRTVSVGDERSKMRVAGVQGFCVSKAHRGTDLSRRMMYIAMEKAIKRRFDAGLLFCIPELEAVYTGMGWRKLNSDVYMLDEEKGKTPIPAKNITMYYPPGKSSFPPGDVDLAGTDW